MSRLIDADAFIEEARNRIDMQDLYLPVHIKEMVLDEMPTVDAVPVVRCKDCGWYEVARYTKEGLPDKRCKPSLCSMWVCCTEPDFYCAYGERGKSFFKIDAVPVRHGKWMEIIEVNELGDAYQSGVYCSECGYTDSYEPNYCPNCGARMDEVDE